ncbi:AAA family ATPase [Streptomyces sp. NBC_00083]|uniref:AAA family ATPase n=1 Tax=Streptomyces sp. NBC_00083 TaxID=2975647 RepID=UPI0022528E69|nr:AAA family ATPase [Streptomyces sp. NBC_00083]MCX5384821.1 AAA family ATPase [Streptomyces sp. NBC_00083]
MQIVLVSGPSGSGKTTVARILAERMLSPSVHLHTDDFYAAIKQGAVAPYLPEAHEQNQTVTAVIAQAAAGYAAGGYHTVVDGVVGPWFLEAYEKAAEAAGVGLVYVVLRPDRESRSLAGRPAINTRSPTGRSSTRFTTPSPTSALTRRTSSTPHTSVRRRQPRPCSNFRETAQPSP